MNQTNARKKLGIWTTTSLVIGNMIGAGVFLMPSVLAKYGGISILGWIFSSLGALVLAYIFSRLSKYVRNSSGGPYAFSRDAFGGFLGFLVAWGYWISIWVTNAAIAVAFVGALSVLFPVLGIDPVWAVIGALGSIWLLSWVNTRGVHSSGKLQLVTTLLKVLPLIIIIIGGSFFFSTENYMPFNASDVSGPEAIVATAALTFFAYLGIESATIPAGDIKDPQSTIPRATMMGTLFTILIYVLSTVVIMGMIPLDALAKSPAPFADAMGILAGSAGEKIVAIGAAIAAFGALNGWILVMGQVARATAKDGLFPKIFEKENRRGVPMAGILIGSTLTSVVILMNYTDGLVEQFRFMILLGTLCCVIPYLFSAAAYVMLGYGKQEEKKDRIFIQIIGGIGFIFSLWVIYGTGEEAVFWGTLLLLGGTPFYVWMKQKDKKI